MDAGLGVVAVPLIFGVAIAVIIQIAGTMSVRPITILVYAIATDLCRPRMDAGSESLQSPWFSV